MTQKPTYEELEQRIHELEASLAGTAVSANASKAEARPNETGEIDKFQESLSLVGKALQSAKDVDLVIESMLETVLRLFNCDRIWLFYPCDPNAPTFKVLAEKNIPQYPGAFSSGQELPVTPEAALTIQKALDSGVPAVFDPESGNEIDDVSRKFSVLSQMMMAVHPKTGKPWMFGMHQCSHARVWTTYEQHLFQEISVRVAESLSNRILLEELKKSELILAKQHAEFQAIFNSITDAIVLVDLERHILMANPAFTSIFGYDLEEIKGKTTQILYAHPEEYSLQGKARYHKNAEVTTPVYETEYRRKDGTLFPGETLGVPVKKSNGQIVGFLGVVRDVTERKKAEQERHFLKKQWAQSQKLEALGTLAGGIAHDFNNILSVIFGYTEMAMNDAPAGSKFSKDLDKVLQAAHRAKGLVQQILAFSRQSQAERLSLKPESIVKEALKMLRASIPTTIEIQENIEGDCGSIEADPTQIHQILMNLCTNAFHAMEEKGGILKVALRKTASVPAILSEGRDDAKENFIHLSVSDTGTGIAPEVLDKIFDPFFTTKEKGKGTGMGLAITYGIVKDHGGAITVDSRLGQGTTFHVYLPQSKNEGAPRVIEDKDILPTGTERILFVDDEDLLAEIGKDMLERLGYQVTVKQRSFEALEVFQNQPDQFDIVITDQTMPGMTGLDLARRMIQIRPDIPIILCTGYSHLVNEEIAKAQGIKEFALKPMTKSSMAKLIRKVLGNQL